MATSDTFDKSMLTTFQTVGHLFLVFSKNLYVCLACMMGIAYNPVVFSCCSMVDERVLHECLSFLENHLNKLGSKEAIERFFTSKAGNNVYSSTIIFVHTINL
jgi:hypothetical protein